MSFNTIKTEERDGIYIITLNRPKAKNAMNSEMWQELCWAFDISMKPIRSDVASSPMLVIASAPGAT